MYIGQINAHLTIKEKKSKQKLEKNIFHGTVATQLKKNESVLNKRPSQRILSFFKVRSQCT